MAALGLGSALYQYHHTEMIPMMSRDREPLLKSSAKPWSPRNRPESPRSNHFESIVIPEITLQKPPKLDRPKPLYAEIASSKPIYYQSGELLVRLDMDTKGAIQATGPGPHQSWRHIASETATFSGSRREAIIRGLLIPIEAIESKYEHDEYDGYRRDYGGLHLEDVALLVYEDIKSFETFARRIIKLPQDSFYELQVVKNIITSKYRHYQRTLHHLIMGKIRTLVGYYMREFAHAYDPIFIRWFNHLQEYLTEDEFVKFPYLTHFHTISFNQFIYRDLMEVIMKLRERIMTVDRHLISPIPTEFIINSHYNTVRHMIHEEQLNYVLQNLHKIYHAIQGLINHKISY